MATSTSPRLPAGTNYDDYRLSFLLLDFSGRIGRKQFWYGLLFLVAIDLAGTLCLALLFGISASSYFASSKDAVFLDSLMIAALMFPHLALMFKRLRDRDMGPWLAIALYVLLFLFQFETYFGVPQRLREPDILALLPGAMMIGVLGWVLIECGVMPAHEITDGDDE